MRRPLFMTMIFLLLLRGWVGDAMATGMAAGQLQGLPVATEIVAVHAHEARADGHFDHQMSGLAATALVAHSAAVPPDCAGHSAGQTSDPMTQEAAAHCESCPACQVCHTLALSPLAANPGAVVVAPAPPHSPAAQFASALAALGQKPPIS